MSERSIGTYCRVAAACVVALAALFLAVWGPQAVAGTGTAVSGTPSYFNFNLYYTYTPSDLSVMKNAFQETSRLMFNSTNGQMQIGTVRVSTNSAFQTKADFWVNDGASGAYSSVGGFGAPGTQVTLFSNRHRWTNEDGPDGNERGQFGIVHELGHYVFDLGDEYPIAGGGYPGAYCVSTTSTVGCIMDGGTAIHPNHHRTEWCTPNGGGLTSSHVTTPNTPQQAFHGCSCWDTIVSYTNSQHGISLTAPTAVDTTDPAGLGTVSWVVIGDRLRFTLALDRSYSMSVSNKFDLAKQGATLFTDLCKKDVGESLGVVSFSNTAVSDFPAATVTTTPDTASLADAAINGIALENMTALGDGLRRSLNEITGNGTVAADSSVVEAIVLLSDGVHNYGSETPAAVLPDLRARGVRVFTIGLGSPTDPTYPLDETTLLDISNQTGASYTHATDAADLQTIYTTYAAEVRGENAAPEQTGALFPTSSAKHKFLVDKYTDEETFVLHWPFGNDAFELRLRRPDGVVLPAGAAPGQDYLVKHNHIFYRINKPMPGTWTMLVKAKARIQELPQGHKQAQKKIAYCAQGIAHAPALAVAASPRIPHFRVKELAVIYAFVSAAGVPVAKVSVTGTVRKPDGRLLEVKWFDDGDLRSHGDAKAGDGVYTAIIRDTTQQGTYQAKLLFSNRTGVTATPDEPDPKSKPRRIAPFTRSATTTFSVGMREVTPPKTEKRG